MTRSVASDDNQRRFDLSTGNSHRLAIAGVLLVLVAGLALVTAPIGSADQSQLPVSRCGIVNGATWKYHGRSGNHYAVLAGGTASCPPRALQ